MSHVSIDPLRSTRLDIQLSSEGRLSIVHWVLIEKKDYNSRSLASGSSPSTSGLCGRFANRFFTATVVRAKQKNAGIAGSTSSFFNAAMAAVAKKSVTNFPNGPLGWELLIKGALS